MEGDACFQGTLCLEILSYTLPVGEFHFQILIIEEAKNRKEYPSEDLFDDVDEMLKALDA